MGQSERQIWYRQVPHILDAYRKAAQPHPYQDGDVYGFWVYNSQFHKEFHLIQGSDAIQYKGDIHVDWLPLT